MGKFFEIMADNHCILNCCCQQKTVNLSVTQLPYRREVVAEIESEEDFSNFKIFLVTSMDLL